MLFWVKYTNYAFFGQTHNWLLHRNKTPVLNLNFQILLDQNIWFQSSTWHIKMQCLQEFGGLHVNVTLYVMTGNS